MCYIFIRILFDHTYIHAYINFSYEDQEIQNNKKKIFLGLIDNLFRGENKGKKKSDKCVINNFT